MTGRRKAYTKLSKVGAPRPEVVKGQVVYKGFQCPTAACEHWFSIPAAEVSGEYSFTCPACETSYSTGAAIKRFDFELIQTADNTIIESGAFEVYVDEYVQDAPLFKYCLYCYELKPLEAFGNHAVLASGRQGECKRCKTRYNAIKNQSRTPDQHRDASQKRRLLVDIGAGERFNSEVVRERFEDCCFKCGRDVSDSGAAFDHTLPVRYLWPMTTATATLLCADDNGQKGALWPGQFYDDTKLRRLASLTGLNYDLLRGNPHINPDAIEKLKDGNFVDSLFSKYAHYMPDVIAIRNRILQTEGFDFFESSSNIAEAWKERANKLIAAGLSASGE